MSLCSKFYRSCIGYLICPRSKILKGTKDTSGQGSETIASVLRPEGTRSLCIECSTDEKFIDTSHNIAVGNLDVWRLPNLVFIAASNQRTFSGACRNWDGWTRHRYASLREIFELGSVLPVVTCYT